MNEIKACGLIVCSLIICIIFKNLKSEYSLFVRIIITLSVFTVSISIFYPVLKYIEQITENTYIYQFVPIILKTLGIAFSVQITADICKDAQESSLAQGILFFGQAQILLISIPLIKSLLQICEGLLK